jgi:Asp-tRNA(Asn)/Glu-tRNA(Gln) amidotransferase A subunit family amidase
VLEEEYQKLDGLALAEGIRQRRFSATEVMDCALGLAEILNPHLNAITWKTYDLAREQAIRLDNLEQVPAAPFSGVPFLIKDLSAVAGLPQTSHSRLFEGDVADHDAPVVQAFNQAGLISLGKTNTPELGLTITTESAFAGPCRNPWNLQFSTGGSSGGSAAAVAAGIVPVAHATDGGGSIRVPASCCGLVGLKPSRGLTPVDLQLGASWSGMSVAHVVSRTVRDSAGMLDAVRLDAPLLYPLPQGPQSYLAALDSKRQLRIALQREHPLGAGIHPEVSKAMELTSELLEQLGHQISDAAPPVDYRQLLGYTGNIINVHVAQSIMPQLEKRGEPLDTPLLEEGTRRMAKRGSELTACDYIESVDGIRQIEQAMAAFHRDYDILVSPVMTQPPAQLGWLNMNSDDMKTYAQRFSSYSGFCSLFNATGQPSISVPIHQSNDGLPIGMMFSASWGADAELLQLARQLENVVQWNTRRPALLKDLSEISPG